MGIRLAGGRRDEVRIVLLPQGENSMAAVEPWPVDKDGEFDIRGVLPGSYDALLVFGGEKTPGFMRGDETVRVNSVDVDGLRISPLANGVVRGQFRMDDGRKIDWSQFDISLHSKRTTPTDTYASYSGMSYDAFSWAQRAPRPAVKRNESFEAKDVPAAASHLRVGPTGKALDNFFVKSVNLGA